jgi:hypothetical protein
MRARPSQATIWVNCPASLKLFQNTLIDPGTNQYPEDGTKKHLELQVAIATGLAPQFSDLMDYIEGMEVATEVRLKSFLSPGLEDCSVDVVAVSENHVGIIDYKSGFTPVYAYQNYQLLNYACAYEYSGGNIDRKDYMLTIYQPSRGRKLDHWEVPRKDIVGYWIPFFKSRYESTQEEKPEFRFGYHCDWCPMRAVCPEAHAKAALLSKIETYKGLDIETCSLLYTQKDRISALFKGIEDALIKHLLAGGVLYEWELGKGKRMRYFNDPFLVEEILGEDFYERAQRSPAQVEKLLGEKSYKWKEINDKSLISYTEPKKKSLKSKFETNEEE